MPAANGTNKAKVRIQTATPHFGTSSRLMLPNNQNADGTAARATRIRQATRGCIVNMITTKPNTEAVMSRVLTAFMGRPRVLQTGWARTTATAMATIDRLRTTVGMSVDVHEPTLQSEPSSANTPILRRCPLENSKIMLRKTKTTISVVAAVTMAASTAKIAPSIRR